MKNMQSGIRTACRGVDKGAEIFLIAGFMIAVFPFLMMY